MVEPALLTAEDLMALPDGAWRYQLIRGRLVRMSPTSFEHSDVCGTLYVALRNFVDGRGLGRVSLPETGYLVSHPGEPDTVLAPDLAFVAASRAPARGSADWKGFPRLAPDLVVEVASPSQHRPEMPAKARLWLSVGTRLVWVVRPQAREVDIWRLGADTPLATIGAGSNLDGEDVLPGFVLPVARLFG